MDPDWWKRFYFIFADANPHNASIKSLLNSPIGTQYYDKITEYFLDNFYPKFCPTCKIQLRKKISTRDYLIRCEKCHYQASRLSYTPLHHFKLPLWIFGYVLDESYKQSPKVVTAAEIVRKTGISYKSALLLKRRIQLFASDQREAFQELLYSKLEQEYKEFRLPEEDEEIHIRGRKPQKPIKSKLTQNAVVQAPKAKDVKKKILQKALKHKTITNADTMVLYSASQRANKGRKRHRSKGLTASIYMSDKLGGKQIGTMVHTIAASNGALILDSVPNQKMNTLGPLFRKSIPDNTAIFTDSGYPWLSVYRNHRMVNHTAHSKDKRHRWARNRWSKDGVHVQYAEGNHRVIKQAFSSYGYIRPEYSQLYLNEFCFYRNLKVFGLEALVTKWREKIGVVEEKVEGEISIGYNRSQLSNRSELEILSGSSAFKLKTIVSNSSHHVRNVKSLYAQENEARDHINFELKKRAYHPPSLSDRKLKSDYTNDSFIERNRNRLSKSKFEALRNAIVENDLFWKSREFKHYKRYSEKKYNHFAKLIWENIPDSVFTTLPYILYKYRIPHSSSYRIIKTWRKYNLIELIEGKHRPYIDISRNYQIKRKFTELPNLLYSSYLTKMRNTTK
ncbi:transposase [Leptospira sp. SA-E8]|uniref:transposase n=1 Tax=Leptospira sp. SA-E8 TaxID=3422259 RepID=UPI003EC10B77